MTTRTGSVLPQHAVVDPPESPRAVEVAAAKRGRARAEKTARRENILIRVRFARLQKALEEQVAED